MKNLNLLFWTTVAALPVVFVINLVTAINERKATHQTASEASQAIPVPAE